MADHYYRHVIKEGKRFKTKNIITYTKDAKKLWWNSKGAGKLMSSGSIKLKGIGTGGLFSFRTYTFFLLSVKDIL